MQICKYVCAEKGRIEIMSKLMNEYCYNAKFRDYVDKYCKKHSLTVKEALRHEIVKQVYLYYTEM